MTKIDQNAFSRDDTLYLIDISSLIFRAFYAVRPLHTPKGEPTNSVYGVATMIAKMVEDANPKYLAVIFDSKDPSFRKELYPNYKANRSAPPDELIPQFSRIEQLVNHLGIFSYRQSGLEADDLIASATKEWRKKHPDAKVVIVSSDKDLTQLVSPHVVMWDTMGDRVFDEAFVSEKFGVPPKKIRDYLALVGDSSDNIPGVKGIGPKSASALLNEFETLDGIYEAAEKGEIKGKKSEMLLENKNEAYLSAELATMKEDLGLELNENDLFHEFILTKELIEFLKELHFNRLITQWEKNWVSKNSGTEPENAPREEIFKKFETVLNEKQFEEICLRIEKKKEFVFDLETTSLNTREAKIVGIALCVSNEDAVYIPLAHEDAKQLKTDQVLKRLSPFFENPLYKKIGQNLKYDCNVLFEYGVNVKGIGSDTMVASYVIEPEGRHDMDTLARDYLEHHCISFEDVCGKGKNQIGFNEVPIDKATDYAAEDAWVTYRLWETFLPLLKEQNLLDLYSQVDLPLVEVLAAMEREGVLIDSLVLGKLSKEFTTEMDKIEKKILTFSKGELNLNSPKQLGVFLFDELKLPVQKKTKTGYSTDASVLEILAPLHEVPRLLLEYREIHKLISTYIDPLPKLIDKKSGRVHTNYQQTVAATGRLASSNPNLQNIPIRTERGKRMRGAFVAKKGCLFVAADYSQVELRILAHMSEDKDLCSSFELGEDVHARTASEIFDVPTETISSEQRSIAKAINFGLMYGKTPFGLAKELGISRTDAKTMIDRYFERYRGVKEYFDKTIEAAKKDGYVSTLLGRRRYLKTINDRNPTIRGFAERMAMNSPIQGTAADLVKIAMNRLFDELNKGNFKSKMILQVHDELVLECPEDEVKEVQKLLSFTMENAMQLRVPLVAESSVGKNWMELK